MFNERRFVCHAIGVVCCVLLVRCVLLFVVVFLFVGLRVCCFVLLFMD